MNNFVKELLSTGGVKPWLDPTVMAEIYSSPVINSDEDVSILLAEYGHEVSRRAITDARNSFGIPAKSKANFFNVERDEIDELRADRNKIWNLAAEMQNELRKENHAKKDVHINLETDGPIGVFYMGDLHIGDIGTDHQALIRDAELIQQTEHLYGTMGGDYINNFIKGGKKIKNHEVMPVEFAHMLTEDLFDKLKDSLWMILSGNHDAWTDQAAEFDKISEMSEKIGVPYGKHGANLHIAFPDGQSYKIRLRHKYRFESQQNLLNAVKQMHRFDEHFDVGVLHHLHQPGFEMWMQSPNGACWAIRPGSYKVEDDFAYELGYTSSGFGMSRTFGTEESCKYSVPVSIFWPGERRINVMPTIADGIEFLNYARDSWQREKDK